MKPETETAVRSIVMIDSEVTRENLERAIDIMRGKISSDEELVHTIRGGGGGGGGGGSRRTLTYYLDHGYIDRVFGCGCRALGVSRESLLRFMNRRVVRRSTPQNANLLREYPRGRRR